MKNSSLPGGSGKICVTAQGKTLNSAVDPRFGRCQNFIFVDLATGQFEAEENPHAQFQGGAGIQSGQMVASRGVEAVLTGHIGPNAHQVLSGAGIRVLTGVSGTVQEAMEGYKKGIYQSAQGPDVGSKFGMPRS